MKYSNNNKNKNEAYIKRFNFIFFVVIIIYKYIDCCYSYKNSRKYITILINKTSKFNQMN
jgi:hypothetical protein